LKAILHIILNNTKEKHCSKGVSHLTELRISEIVKDYLIPVNFDGFNLL